MNDIISEIKDIFLVSLNKLKYKFECDNLIQACSIQNKGDFQCNISLALAKIYKKPPMKIAEEIVSELPHNSIIANYSIDAPGYINFFIEKDYLDTKIRDSYKSFSRKCKYSSEMVLVDYGGANVAKPLHVGHLRSATIGESIKRICKYVGNNVLSDIHLGDWGLQMGMIICELRSRHPNWIYFDPNYSGEYPNNSPISICDLETLYPEANAKAKENEQYMQEAKMATFELQNGRRGYIALWKHILNVSKKDLKKNYDELNTKFDLWLGESDSQKYYKWVINHIILSGMAKNSKGALVVDISEPEDKNELPPFILRKSDGAVLYSTTDLATIVQRDREYGVDRVIYVVDNRQEMHFKQLFRCVEKTNITTKKIKLDFAGFGTMNGKDGKPYKTRDGGVMPLKKLIQNVKIKEMEKILQNNKQYAVLSKNQINNLKNKTAISALKFADLSIHRSKDYIFDIDKFCSFDGKTGPYILYTIARANSILTKANFKIDYQHNRNFNSKYYDNDLVILLLSFRDVIIKSYHELAPNLICDYVYKLANKFNSFYNSCNIIQEKNAEKKFALLSLTEYVLKVLKKAMFLLGIKTLNKM